MTRDEQKHVDAEIRMRRRRRIRYSKGKEDALAGKVGALADWAYLEGYEEGIRLLNKGLEGQTIPEENVVSIESLQRRKRERRNQIVRGRNALSRAVIELEPYAYLPPIQMALEALRQARNETEKALLETKQNKTNEQLTRSMPCLTQENHQNAEILTILTK